MVDGELSHWLRMLGHRRVDDRSGRGWLNRLDRFLLGRGLGLLQGTRRALLLIQQ